MDPPHKLGGEWLTVAKLRDKDTRTEYWRARQHTIRKNQSKEFQKLNDFLQPIWPLDCDGVPYASLADDDDIITESDDDSIMSAAGPCCEAPEVATEVVVPPPRRP